MGQEGLGPRSVRNNRSPGSDVKLRVMLLPELNFIRRKDEEGSENGKTLHIILVHAEMPGLHPSKRPEMLPMDSATICSLDSLGWGVPNSEVLHRHPVLFRPVNQQCFSCIVRARRKNARQPRDDMVL